MKSKVIAVIAAYNEEKRISKIINEILKLKIVEKIIVVDDGSTDKTSEVSRKPRVKVIRYEKNQGVGYATKVGLNEAIKMKPDILIILDSDGQHDPKYIPDFIEKVNKGFDYVYGLRDLYNYPFDRKIGNWGLRLLTNLLCPSGIIDTECGYRALTIEAAKKIKLKAKRYEREVDFAYEVWRNKFRISFVKIMVPVFYPKFAIIRGFKNFIFLFKRRFNLIK
jgi:glycosyltransferase involved in cell wall biosynthesis